jgi:DNA-3-methyladenine glycosylase
MVRPIWHSYPSDMSNQSASDFAFLNGLASEVAPLLLGSVLEREVDGQLLRARIVETEAYDETDAASHSYHGKTPRTEIMFGPAGFLYVYFTYGMHYCCNIVTGPPGYGAAVLLRSLEPLQGADDMVTRRRGRNGVQLTNGPAKLCQALAIDKQLNGHDLREVPLRLLPQVPIDGKQIIQTTRVGITRAVAAPWRFYIQGNPYVSKG